MPNRILKESICISDTIDQLSWFEECLFYRLIVNCDDYGRFDGRLPIIRSRLFPLKNITDKTIEESINRLSTVGLVAPFHYDNRPILQLATWDRHQNVRNLKGTYPGINGDYAISASDNIKLIREQLKSSDINCNQMISDAPLIQSNTIQSNPNTNPNRNPKNRARERVPDPPGFYDFWQAYPRKDGKAEARKAFAKAGVPVEELLLSIERQKRSAQWQEAGGKYIPYASTWLNQRRWEDEGTDIVPETKPVTRKGSMYEMMERDWDFDGLNRQIEERMRTEYESGGVSQGTEGKGQGRSDL